MVKVGVTHGRGAHRTVPALRSAGSGSGVYRAAGRVVERASLEFVCVFGQDGV